MAHRYHSNLSGSRHDSSTQRPWDQSVSPVKDPSAVVRPLSDIREITEPSIPEILPLRTTTKTTPPVGKQTSLKQSNSVKRGNSVRIVEPSNQSKGKQRQEPPFFSSSDSTGSPETTSSYSYPHQPPQKPPILPRSEHLAKGITVDGHAFPQVPVRVPDRGRASSPVRRIGERLDPVASDSSRRVPSHTFVRNPCPFDIVDQPISRHSRVTVQLQTVAPLFVGGGSIEGFVRVVIDGADGNRQRRSLMIARIAVDLIGIEELVGQHRRSVFLCLATELIHAGHPPPADMVESVICATSAEAAWTLRPLQSQLPFRISLPLDVGPAPFTSRTARIRYILCASVHLLDIGRPLLVRTSQDVTVLSTYDQKALRCLPSPLTAFDEVHMARHGIVDNIRLTAGLHRQVWVSGTSLFVDVHVVNNSQKHLKKLELSVERDILYYKHAAASTLEKSASQARIFQDKEQSILSKSSLKPGWPGWDGIPPHSTMVRTCGVELPRGHSTVRCGKFFEVRYFLNVTISTSHIKLLSVQLPIILIHMNSLDVVPNAVSQVAAAIEEKRAQHQQAQSRKTSGPHPTGIRRLGSNASNKSSRARPADVANLQGKAFAAPRQQSLERLRASEASRGRPEQAEARSPRKHRPRHKDTGRASPPLSRQRSVPHHQRGRHDVDPGPNLQHDFAIRPAPSAQPLVPASLGSFPHLNSSSSSPAPSNHQPSTQRHDLPSFSGTVRRTIAHMRSFESLRRRRPSASSLRSDIPSRQPSTTSSVAAAPARPIPPGPTRPPSRTKTPPSAPKGTKGWKHWLTRKKPPTTPVERSGWL